MPTHSNHTLSDAYASKDVTYYTNARSDYVDLLPNGANVMVLELGCGNGATGALALAKGKASGYVGIELIPAMAAEAASYLTTVHQGDVEHMDLPYTADTFDVLILSEVLEHLVDPWAVVRRLTGYLKPGALVLASSPNLGYWKNIISLAMGRFDYTDSGMMDRTHLRWFTPGSFQELFSAAEIIPDRVLPLNPLNRFERLIQMTRFKSLVYFQINFRGHFSPKGRKG